MIAIMVPTTIRATQQRNRKAAMFRASDIMAVSPEWLREWRQAGRLEGIWLAWVKFRRFWIDHEWMFHHSLMTGDSWSWTQLLLWCLTYVLNAPPFWQDRVKLCNFSFLTTERLNYTSPNSISSVSGSVFVCSVMRIITAWNNEPVEGYLTSVCF